jgi:hypothetical protein
MLLVVLSALVAVIACALPFTAFGVNFFRFVPPEIKSIQLIFSIVAGYFVTTELIKIIYYRFARQS